jgi:CHAT domain-containing protein
VRLGSAASGWVIGLALAAALPLTSTAAQTPQPATAPASPWPDLAASPPDIRAMTREEQIGAGGGSALVGSIAYQSVADGWEKLLKLHIASYGPDHPRTAFIRVRLAEAWIDLRRYADAERELLAAEAAIRARTEPGHPLRLFALSPHSLLLGRQQRVAEQIALAQTVLTELAATAKREPGRLLPVENWQGLIAARQGDYAAAERHYRAWVDRVAAQPGAGLAERGPAADGLANHLIDMGRAGEAAALLAPLIAEAGQDEKANAALLGSLQETAGRAAEDQVQFLRSEKALLKARELRKDDELLNPKRASATRIAARLTRQRRLEGRFDAPFAAFEGPDSFTMGFRRERLPKIADGIDALVVEATADVDEAGPLWSGETLPQRRDVLAWYEQRFGADHPQTARARRALAAAELDMGRPWSAEAEVQRALAAQRAAIPGANDEVGRTLLLLGRVYLAQGRRAEALAAFSESLRQFDRPQSASGYWTREALMAVARTGDLLRDTRRSAESWKRIDTLPAPAADELGMPVLRQMLALMQGLVAHLAAGKQCLPAPQRAQFATMLRQLKPMMAASPGVVDTGFYTLAEAEACAGAFDAAAAAITEASASAFSMIDDASPRAAEATAIRQARLVRAFMADDKRMASNHIETVKVSPGVVGKTAFQSAADIGWSLANAETIARNLLTGAMTRGADLDAIRARSQMEEGGRSIFDQVFTTRLDFDWRVHELQDGPGPVIEERTGGLRIGYAIAAAQDLERAGAAQVLAQASARLASGNDAIGALLRRREQLSTEQRRLAAEIAQATIAGPAATPTVPLATLRGQSDTLLRELSAIDAQLQKDYPDYFALTRPQSFSLAQIQAKLADGEALLLVRPNGDDVHVFVVTKERMAWNRLTGAAPEIAGLVATLRCDIDKATCGKAAGGTRGASRGPTLLRSGEAADDAQRAAWQAPAFDRTKAWRLHQLLLEPIAKVFEPQQPWEKPVTRLYTVVSGPLSALPLGTLVTAKPADDGQSTKGATLLDTPWLADRFTMIGLPSVSSLGLKPPPAGTAGAAVVGYGDPILGVEQSQEEKLASFLGFVTRADDRMRARPNALRALDNLPGTRAELEAVSALFDQGKAMVRLQGEATEAAVKRDTALSGARVVIFSTHGLLPGEVLDNVEPGLVLTPPATASDLDDGLLTASEAATLSLDADLLVLSACNTATTDGTPGAESLSSLARAFLYAGTRGIYASHWRVSDTVTSRLMLIALQLRRDGRSRAEALSAAMHAIRTGKMPDGSAIPQWTPDWAHPAAWAPFVIISGSDG